MDSQTRLKEIRAALDTTYGERLKGVVLYGSEARGTASLDSDIDVLVLLDGPIRLWRDTQAAVRALYPLSLRYERPISAKPVDVRQYEAAKYPLYVNAKAEGALA